MVSLLKIWQPILPCVYSKVTSSEEVDKKSDVCCPKPDPNADEFQLPEGCPCNPGDQCDSSFYDDEHFCDSEGFDDCDTNPFCHNRCATTCCSENDCRQGQICKELPDFKSSKLDLQETKNLGCWR